MNSFSELALSAGLQRNLDRNGFTTPTPVQAEAIPPALAGSDVVATAQTGTGKTLAFAIPIIQALAVNPGRRGVHAVILAPTRELAMQINEAFAQIAAGSQIRTALVVGGLNENPQIRAIRSGAQVVIATPGRLCDFLDRKLVDLKTTAVCVLDEADRMLDMGFLPSIKAILDCMPESRQTLLFSATIEKSVAHLVKSYVRNPVRVAIGSTTKPAENVDLDVYEIDHDRKLPLLSSLLTSQAGSFLVFARTKHGADRLAKQLSRGGYNAARIHGDRTQNQRNQALRGFQDGSYRVLVATDVAARGIHVDGIAHVVNYDLPQVAEDFIHRVGRTGRAGARGTASTFATRGERSDLRQIEKTIGKRLLQREIPSDLPKLAPPSAPVRDSREHASSAPAHHARRAQQADAPKSPWQRRRFASR